MTTAAATAACSLSWCTVDHRADDVDGHGSRFHWSGVIARWERPAPDDNEAWEPVGDSFEIQLIAFDDGKFDPPARETRVCVGPSGHLETPALRAVDLRDLAQFIARYAQPARAW